MDMADKGKNLPPQGDRTPRGRREGDIVPVPLPSSSSNGQSPSSKSRKRRKGGDEEEKREARKIEKEPSLEKPPSARVKEDGFLFEDGTFIRWEDSQVSPLFQRVIIDMEGGKKWTPSKRRYLSQCLSSLDWEETWEELNEALKTIQRSVKTPEWRLALQYIMEVALGVEVKASALKEELEAARAAAGGIIPLRAENAALRRELEELRGRASIRPPSQDVGVQASTPQVEGETPVREAESPLEGVLSGILSRLDALEGGLKEVLRRPGSYAQAVKGKKGERGGRSPAVSAAGAVGTVPRPPRPEKDGGVKKRKRASFGATKGKGLPRPSTMAAVTVTVPPGARLSYAEVMASAREKISLEETGVQPPQVRRARTGGLVLEIPGPDGEAGADRLADRLTTVLGPLGVRIGRPLKTADLRLRGLDDSVTPEEVVAAVAAVGECDAGRVRVGSIRSSPASAGACWLRCPVSAAVKIAGAGRLKVGWASAAVELLSARPLRCFKCLEVGHLRVHCTSEVDRGDRCYRCGGSGHRAAVCSSEPRCPLCVDGVGVDSAHVLGGRGCRPKFPPEREVSSSPTPVEPAGKSAEPAHRKVGRRKEGESPTPPPPV